MITVFTPAYNRGYIIENLYNSLRNQTVKDFEWIVVDDGSTDNTEELFKNWQSLENGFELTYKKVSNGGKHRAINLGTDLAKGELFFIVDSDDYISLDAIEKIIKMESTISGLDNFAGVSGLKVTFDNKIIGSTFKNMEYIDAFSYERRKYNLLGDKSEVYYTKVLRKHKFPEFEGERFLTESIVWDRIARDGYKVRWFNEKIYFCEYLEDGLTSGAINLRTKNPQGYRVSCEERLLYAGFLEKLAIVSLYTTDVLLGDTKKASKDLNVNIFFVNLSVLAGKIRRKITGR